MAGRFRLCVTGQGAETDEGAASAILYKPTLRNIIIYLPNANSVYFSKSRAETDGVYMSVFIQTQACNGTNWIILAGGTLSFHTVQ